MQYINYVSLDFFDSNAFTCMYLFVYLIIITFSMDEEKPCLKTLFYFDSTLL